MARIIENKLLFIHVPKTGGTFIRELVNCAGFKNRETGLYEEHDHYGVNDITGCHDFITFGCVRKPYEWVISRWKWAVYTEFPKKVIGGTKAKHHWMADVWSDDINEFLFNVINKRSGIAEESMFQKLGIGTEKQANVILTCENLKSGIIELFKKELAVNVSEFIPLVYNDKAILTPEIKFSFFKEEIEKQNKGLIDKFYASTNKSG